MVVEACVWVVDVFKWEIVFRTKLIPEFYWEEQKLNNS